VPRAKLACGRVGDDGDGMAVQPGRPGGGVHVLGSMRRGGCVHVPGSRCVSLPTPQSESGELVRGRVFSCEAETGRARRRLVRGGDWSEGVPLVGNWSEMLPIGRERDVLPVRVLTGGPQSSLS
jgi:hypothetical protein